MRTALALACLGLTCLGGCGVMLGGPAGVSGQSPGWAAAAANAPQPPGSLPPGAAGIGGGPNVTEPNRLSATLPTPF